MGMVVVVGFGGGWLFLSSNAGLLGHVRHPVPSCLYPCNIYLRWLAAVGWQSQAVSAPRKGTCSSFVELVQAPTQRGATMM